MSDDGSAEFQSPRPRGGGGRRNRRARGRADPKTPAAPASTPTAVASPKANWAVRAARPTPAARLFREARECAAAQTSKESYDDPDPARVLHRNGLGSSVFEDGYVLIDVSRAQTPPPPPPVVVAADSAEFPPLKAPTPRRHATLQAPEAAPACGFVVEHRVFVFKCHCGGQCIERTPSPDDIPAEFVDPAPTPAPAPADMQA